MRWQGAVLSLALLAAACGDQGGEAPQHGSEAPSEGGLADALLDAGGTLRVPEPRDSAADSQDAGAPDAEASTPVDASILDSTALSAWEAATPVEDLGAANPCGAAPAPLAANIKVRELSLYQAVKVPLYKANAWVTQRNALVVQAKKALVRAFVEPQSGFVAHTLRGVLALDNAGATTVLTSERKITHASTDDDADSTFDFAIPSGLLGPDVKVSFSLLETTCLPASEARTGARLPVTGTQAIYAEDTGTLHLVIVPITLGGRTPDTSAAQLDKVRDALHAYYPVASVEVTARAPITWSNAVHASGTGWTELLTQIQRTRQHDGVAGNVYYFGWVNPSESFRDYCRSGCVLGLAPETKVISRSNQIGLGVGFAHETTVITVVHELGHAHGLPHAPCAPRGGSIDSADAKFPYADAKIGVWGWDARSDKLLAPSDYVDMMSYCEPAWISDYNYQKLAVRSKAVNSATFIHTSDKQARETWRGVILYADGSARWSGVTLHERPGELSDARALDGAGELLSELKVVRVPLSNEREAFLYLPEPQPGWAGIELGDRTLRFGDIAPALE
jgi:hypothetical protein